MIGCLLIQSDRDHPLRSVTMNRIETKPAHTVARLGVTFALGCLLPAGCGLAGTATVDLLGGDQDAGAIPEQNGSKPPDSGAAPAGDAGSTDDCRAGAACPQGAPFCDPETGDCAECLAPTDCGADNRTCDPATHTCVSGCSADTACPPAAPYCNLATGECLICTRDEHCPQSTLEQHPHHCDLDLGRCVDCRNDDDCTTDPTRPYCEPLYRECVGCVDDSQCGDDETCTRTLGRFSCVHR